MSRGKNIYREEAIKKGDKYYFDDRPCKNGHLDKRLVSNYSCSTCLNINKRKDYYKNFEKRSAAKKEWKNINLKKVKIVKKRYYEENKELLLSLTKKWRKDNPEKVREIGKISSANRRARKKRSGGHFNKEDVEKLYKNQKGKCATCLKLLDKKFEVDHIMPLFLGGSNWPKNLQILCISCNRRKQKKHPDQWARENGRLL